MKKSFILHYDSLSVIDKMKDEQVGQLLRMMKSYHNGKDYVCEDFAVELVFEQFKNQFDRDLESYESVCERNKAIAERRWSKKSTKSTTRIITTPESTRNADSDSDSDSDNKNDSDKDIINKDGFSSRIIALSKIDKATDKALDKATIKATDETTDIIDKQITNNNKQNISGLKKIFIIFRPGDDIQIIKDKIYSMYDKEIIRQQVNKYKLLLLFIEKGYDKIEDNIQGCNKFFDVMVDKSHRYGYSAQGFADWDILLLKAKEMFERAEGGREIKNYMSTYNKFLSPNNKK